MKGKNSRRLTKLLDFMPYFLVLRAEKGIMSSRKSEIVSYIFSQSGVLPSMMKQHPSLGNKITAWLTGEKPVLIIGGEPASGKSLLMGELILRYRELVKLHSSVQRTLALISYDQIHTLVFKHFIGICKINEQNFLPEGETDPEARKLVTDIMRHVLLFAIEHLSKNTPIILEAPLIDYRGEAIVDELITASIPVQVLIMHSPPMRLRVLNQDEQQIRERSAQALAMEQIHETLLREREITLTSKQDQDRALEESWKHWLNHREGLVLSWNPADDEDGFERTISMLKEMGIPPDPLIPEVLKECAITYLTEEILKTLPDLQVFALQVLQYRK